MRKILILLLKLVLIAGIFGFLFWKVGSATDADGKNIFHLLFEQPKRWDLLFGAFLLQCFAVSVTFVRWRWLLRALSLQCSRFDAFRLGFLGLLLNLAPFGIVGGDAMKAVLMAQKNPLYKSQAVGSVVVDRVIGLLVMFLLGTIGILITGFAFRPELIARTFSWIVFGLTAAGFLGSALVFTPLFTHGHVERLLEKIPFAGSLAAKLTNSMLLYRNHKRCLMQSFLITFLVHLPFGLSLYWISIGLFSSSPDILGTLGTLDTLKAIMFYNVTNLTAMIPLAAGPFELVLEQLFQLYKMNVGTGLIVALGFRLTSILVAMIGVFFYLIPQRK